MKDWALTDEETKSLLTALRQMSEAEQLEEGWVHYHIAIPKDFAQIFEETLAAYKIFRETEKTFPALEAIIMEARNALPKEVLECLPTNGC